MPLALYKSADGRYRSEFYNSDGNRAFAIAEKTAHGVLVSEFNEDGEVLDQIYKKSNLPLAEIAAYLKKVSEKVQVEEVEKYQMVDVNATCEQCGAKSIRREMDILDPATVTRIAVVPIFVCSGCGKKFYSMTQGYLKNLVARNVELFEGEEKEMRRRDEAAFIKEIQEYMIRIFASKKLARMKINK